MPNVDLDRGVVLGGDDPVRGRALPGDVEVHHLTLLVLHGGGGDGGLQEGGSGVLDLFSLAAAVRSQWIWWICRWSQVECRRRSSTSPLPRVSSHVGFC